MNISQIETMISNIEDNYIYEAYDITKNNLSGSSAKIISAFLLLIK